MVADRVCFGVANVNMSAEVDVLDRDARVHAREAIRASQVEPSATSIKRSSQKVVEWYRDRR
jgi:hypothetical protein